ncbi:FAD-dependent oxidoreductase [Pantoea anthophila]|uniref:FAD-dependent oxidoreductase n=1 Tax=Pantoea anthophila TaxID=470931 RepID=UPI00277FFA77|nr:FAD-dependent oxidoreductase [Pantoea anthophila]MDQ1212098.1 NADPH-dependent 2,4-dienoyl-CoA reductase/sulfur reductase-like enzyme/nitrite reductase/ring-hydroxylating ferredoxin subunit [Pantoea anthophila]
MNYQFTVDLKDLPQRQPVKKTLGEVELLLIREGERVRAYQATCPHAGAPLEQGAICGDRLVCPWHKAAFNLADGKMCEPLALADLKQYPLRIEEGRVLVNPEAMSPAAPIGSGADAPVFVVLGGGAAGSAALWRLRHEGYKGRLVLVEREADAPYDRTALTKFVPSGKMDISEVPQLLKADVMDHVERIQASVSRLDAQQQRLIFEDGESLAFDKLLIASGAAPVRPDIPGSDLEGVHLLRSKAQTDQLLQAVDASHKVVIIGNSFIGTELASALRNRDIDVTVIARQTLPFAKQFGDQIGRYFYQLHQKNGVKWEQGEIESLQGDQQVSSVQLKGGRQLPATVVLFATGVKPATDFIHDLPLAEDGSLQADAELKVAENIWVAGDIATYPSAQGPLRIEHYRVAHQQGQTVARNMLDQHVAFERVPFFWTTQYGTRYEYLGHAREWDNFQLLGALEEKKFIACYGQQGELAAICSCGMYTLTAELVERMQQPMTFDDAVAYCKAAME